MGKSVRGGSSFFDAIDQLDVADKKKSSSQVDSQNGTTKTSPSSSKSQSLSQGKGDDSFFGAMDKIEAQPEIATPTDVKPNLLPDVSNVPQPKQNDYTFKPYDPEQPPLKEGDKLLPDVSNVPQPKQEENTYKPLPTTYDHFDQQTVKQANGSEIGIDPKTIPINPYKSSADYVAELQKRVDTGNATPQDETVLKTNQKLNNTNYSPFDDEELNTLSAKYKIEAPGESIDSKLGTIEALKNKIQQDQINEDNQFQSSGGTGGASTFVKNAGVPKGDKLEEYNQLSNFQTKLADEKNKSDVGAPYIEAVVSQDESGNLLNKLKNRVLAMFPQTSAIGSALISAEVQNKIEKLPVDFSFGVNRLKYIDPEQYLRLTKSLTDKAPISQSQIAQVTAQGIESRENILKDAYIKQQIDKPKFLAQSEDLKKSRYENIVNNPEVLRSFLSAGIADAGDDVGEANHAGFDNNTILFNKTFGNTWDYSGKEIDDYGKAVAQANGIDPNDARVIAALQYLKDNEGWMIWDNSIAKSGYARDITKGLIGPIRGVSGLIEDISKPLSAIYAEGQSQGNVNVSEQRVSRVKNSIVENTVSDILEGTGQFITQAGLAAVTSGAIGIGADALAASSLGATTAGEAIGTVSKIGQMLNASKNNMAVFITSYAQAYDQDLKQALTYTSDNNTARVVANGMAMLEGATELWLSPLEIAEGISAKLLNKKELSRGIIDILSDAAIVNKNVAVKQFLSPAIKNSLIALKAAGKETGRVLLGEIGEEEVTQWADYVSNAITNPQSKSFQNRDVMNEMGSTALQTGLSMVVPALLSGVGAFRINNFSKGSLLVAAQNRQQLIDDMGKRVYDGDMTQEEMNEKAAIVNSAAKANETLPVKDNGQKLNTNEKTDYIFSRVSEGILNKKLEATDDQAVKRIIEKKITEQQDFREKILLNKKSDNEKTNNTPGTESTTGTQSSQSAENADGTQSTEGTKAKPILNEAATAIIGAPDVSGLPPDAIDASLTQKQKPPRNATTVTPEGQQPENNTGSSKQEHAPVGEGQQGQAASEAAQPSANGSNQSIGSESQPAKEKIKVPAYVVQVKAGANDVKVPVMKNAIIAAQDEGTIKDILKEVSDQWHDEGSRSQTERDYGKKIVDIAKEMFPQESQKSLSVSDGVENPALKDVESTAKALENISKNKPNIEINFINKQGYEEKVNLNDTYEFTQPEEAGLKGETIKGFRNQSNTGVVPFSAVSEAYHKAKADSSNPELVKAVESLLSKEQPSNNISSSKTNKNETNQNGQNGIQQNGQESRQNGNGQNAQDNAKSNANEGQKENVVTAASGNTEAVNSESKAITDLLSSVGKGEMNADDAAIKLDKSGVEVSNEVYDNFRDAEKKFKKGEQGLQVGDTVTVKGKNGNADFEGNFRGITKEGKYIVVKKGGMQSTYDKSDIKESNAASTEQGTNPIQPKPARGSIVENPALKDVDAKKADIEKRREEKLFAVPPFQKSTSDTFLLDYRKKGKFLVDEAVKGKASEYILNVIKLAIEGRSAKTIAKETSFSEKDVRYIRFYLDIPSAGAIGTIGGQSEFSIEDQQSFDNWKNYINKINAKYDEELTSLEKSESLLSKASTEQTELKVGSKAYIYKFYGGEMHEIPVTLMKDRYVRNELNGQEIPIEDHGDSFLSDKKMSLDEAFKKLINESPEQVTQPLSTQLPKKGDKVLDTKKNVEVTVTKVFTPAKGSALENEPFLMNVKYDDGTPAINMPFGKRFTAIPESNTELNTLPVGGDLKGVTNIEYEDNGDTILYGTKTNKTRVSVKGMSVEEIQAELKYEKQILEKSKKEVATFDEKEIWESKGMTRDEKLQSIKMNKQSAINNEQVEKIIIPFYENKIIENETTDTNTEAQAERTTEAIINTSEINISQSESATKETEVDGAIKTIDSSIKEVEAKIVKLIGTYTTQGIRHKTPSVEIAKQAKKDVAKYAKSIAKMLGWEIPEKNGVNSNIPPAGGEVSFRLNIPNTAYQVYVQAKYDPDYTANGGYDNYAFRGMIYNLQDNTERGGKTYGNSFNAPGLITSKEMAEILKPFAEKALAARELLKERENQNATSKVVTIMKEPSLLSDSKVDEGVSYELFKNEKGDNFPASVKVTNLDSGNIVSLRQYSTLEKAQAQYDELAKVVDAFPEQKTIPVKKVERLVRDEKDQAQINAAIAKFIKGSGGLTIGGIDSERIEAGVELVGLYMKKGIYKFTDIIQDFYAHVGEEAKTFFAALKSVYSTYREGEATDKEYAQMDSNLRDFTFENIVKNFTDGTETGSTDNTTVSDTIRSDKAGVDGNQQTTGVTDNEPAGDATKVPGGPGGVGKPNRTGTTDKGAKQGRSATGSERNTSGPISAGTGAGQNERQGVQGNQNQTGRLKELPKNEADQNHIIKPSDVIVPEGNPAKVTANMDAVMLVRKLENESRNASPAEKRVLAKFVGWGGLASYLKGFENEPEQRIFDNIFNGAAQSIGYSYSKSQIPATKKIDIEGKSFDEIVKEAQRKYAQTLAQFPDLSNWVDNEKSLPLDIARQYVISHLITPAEFQAAVNSTINAHYTDRSVITPIWDLIKKLGFTGGNTLESSAGVGHFFGLMPEELQKNSNLTGVELDQLTGRILKKLYPDANIQVKGFETTNFPNNSFDLAVSNVPFASLSVADPKNKDIQDFSLHNYFIAKNLKQLKPGGIAVMITSKSTMDNAISAKARRWFLSPEGGNSELVGAIRLPNNAFDKNAATQVTTDVMVFQKRKDNIVRNVNPFANTEMIRSEIIDGAAAEINVNEYYIANPNNMIGEMKFAFEVGSGGLYGKTDATLHAKPGTDIAERLNDIIDKFPTDILDTEPIAQDNNIATETKIGKMFAEKGKVYTSNGEQGVEPSFNSKKPEQAKIALAYIPVRDAVKNLVTKELSNATDEEIENDRKALNKLYDAFVKKYGTINKNDFLYDHDIEFSIAAAAEDVKETTVFSTAGGKSKKSVEVKKAAIFDKRLNFPRQEPTKAENLSDAIQISLAYKNYINADYIGAMTGVTADEAITNMINQKLVFENPIHGLLETPEEYLSGDVRKKLQEAKDAVESNPDYMRNVVELEKVQPEDKAMSQIPFKMGVSWIPASMYMDFIKEKMGVEIPITYLDKAGSWALNKEAAKGIRDSNNTTTYAVGKDTGIDIISDIMANRTTVITDAVRTPTGITTVKNEALTGAAADMQAKIIDEFRNWIASHPTYGKQIERVYNDRFNNLVDKTYNTPPFEYFPGASTALKLRIHQFKSILRGTSGNPLLLAHGVGTGKTAIMQTIAMEWRRLKTAKKPMIVVQNSTLKDFAAKFHKLYPSANLLISSEADKGEAERRRFYARIAQGDWDAIIIPQSQFDRIQDNPDRVAAYLQERIDEMKQVMGNTEDKFIKYKIQKEIEGLEEDIDKSYMDKSELAAIKTKAGDMYIDENTGELKKGEPASTRGKGGKQKVKVEAEKILKLNARIQKQAARRTDNVMYFEDLGIDGLIVDEAHEYKKLGFQTGLQNIRGIDTGVSQKALSLYMKSAAVKDKTGGKNIVFATGTPITNTMAESWTMMRYLQPEVLESMGIQYFDQFANTFTEVVPSLEQNAGGRFEVVQRMKEFINAKQLQSAFKKMADVVTTDDIPEFLSDPDSAPPALEGGKFASELIPISKPMASAMKLLTREYDNWKALKGEEKRELSWMPLVLYQIAKKASIDLRLVDPRAADDPESKVNYTVKNALKIYNDFNDYKGTQMIFADSFQSGSSTNVQSILNVPAGLPQFNLYEDIKKKLIAGGVPASEILIMTDIKTDNGKLAMQDKMNTGEVRFVLGSTAKMGIGVNAHERMIGLHHIDAPDRPDQFTQRNGRILRPGNMFTKLGIPVKILTYGIKDTRDATSYGRLRDKEKFVTDFMTGKGGDRIEDTGAEDEAAGAGDFFSEMSAQLSGSKFATELIFAEKDLRTESNRADAFYQKKRESEYKLSNKKSGREEIKDRIKRSDAALTLKNKAFPDNKITQITLNGVNVSEKMSDAIDLVFSGMERQYNAAQKKLDEEAKEAGKKSSPAAPPVVTKFKINGVDASMELKIHWDGPRVELFIPELELSNKTVTSGASLLATARNYIKDVDDQPQRYRDLLKKEDANIETLKKNLTEVYDDSKLEGMYARVSDLKAAVLAESAAKEAADKAENKSDAENNSGFTDTTKKKGVPSNSIVPHPEVNTSVEIVKKELGLSEFESYLYDTFNGVTKDNFDDKVTDVYSKVDDNIDNIEQQISSVEDSKSRVDSEIDKVNDGDESNVVKQGELSKLNSEYRDYEIQEKGFEAKLKEAKKVKQSLDIDELDYDTVHKIINRVNAREQTRKNVKEGIDFFPADANINEILFSSKSDINDFQTADIRPVTVDLLQRRYPDAIVVKSQKDLPQKIRDEANVRGVKEVEGVLYQGSIYLVANNLVNMGRAEGVYRHETIGHQGVIAVLKGQLDKYSLYLVDYADGLQQKAINKLSQRLFGQDAGDLSKNQKVLLGQEYIAMAAEQKDKYPTTWQRIVSFVRNFFRQRGVKLAVSEKDIKVLLANAEKYSNTATDKTLFSSKDNSKTLDEYISKGQAVLKALYPNAELVLHNTQKEYEAATGSDDSRGMAEMGKDKIKIHLNLEKISEEGSNKTVFHEIIHPIIYDAFGVQPEVLNNIWNDLYSQMKGVDEMGKVFDHIAWYNSNKIAAEGLTEFFTQVADGNINIDNIPKSKLSVFIDTINKLLRALGIKFQISNKTDFNQFAKKIKDAFQNGVVDDVKNLISSNNLDKYFNAQSKLAMYDKDMADMLKKAREERDNANAQKKYADSIIKWVTSENPNATASDIIKELEPAAGDDIQGMQDYIKATMGEQKQVPEAATAPATEPTEKPNAEPAPEEPITEGKPLSPVDENIILKELNNSINAKNYPTIFENNEVFNQEAAITQSIGQDRNVSGAYVEAKLDNLRDVSLQTAKTLQNALGKKWKEKIIQFLEQNKTAGSIDQVSGLLNVLSTDIFNQINASMNGTEIAKLEAMQSQVDRLSLDSARTASLALNQRRLYQQFAKGAPIADVLSEVILTPEQLNVKQAVEEALKKKYTDEELNSKANKKTQKTQKTDKEPVVKKYADSVKEDLINRGKEASMQKDADGNMNEVSLKDKIQQAIDSLKGFKC